MLPVLTTDEMRGLDRATMDAGLGGFTLMETAGRGVAEKVLELLETATGRSVIVVCGPGNNGGDGFVVARVLRDHGVDVYTLLAVPRERVTGHALEHLELLEKFGAHVAVLGESRSEERSDIPKAAVDAFLMVPPLGVIRNASIIVDALFGIGTTRPIEGDLATIVGAMNEAPIRVAIDVPSGVNSDTGNVPMTAANREGAFVRATHTVTVAAHKIGIVGSPGFAYAGEISVVDIGIPGAFLPRGGRAAAAEALGSKPRPSEVVAARSVRVERNQAPIRDEAPLVSKAITTDVRVGAWMLEESDIRGWLPIPQPLDHKGTRGHVLVISGAPEMRGAGRLAASAAVASAGEDPHEAAVSALRAGAGLVTLAGDGDVTASEAAVMTKSIGDDGLAPLLEKKTAVVIGPGLGTSDEARARVHEVLKTGKPCVVDADALNLLAKEGADGMGKAGAVIITPHPAEAARLLGCTTAEIEADRMTAARELAKKTHAIVVLKGARTVICDGSEANRSAKVMRCFINPTGAPSLSTGGTGDVLAGLIGGLLAQGVFGVRAACCAAFLHGRAGELLFARYGRGALSSDLPRVIAELLGAMTSRARS